MAPDGTLVASLRATKLIRKGTPVLTCYRNTSSAGTTAQLIKECETLSRMFKCSCCLCGGSCGASRSVVGLGTAAPSSLLDREVPVPWGSNTDLKPAEEAKIAKQPFYQDSHQDPNTGGPKIFVCTRPKEGIPAPTAGLPTPMQLKWSLSADKRKTSRLNPTRNKPTRRSRPSGAARSQKDFFFSPSSCSPSQVLQTLGFLHQFPDVRAAVLSDSEAGEFFCVSHPHTQASPSQN